MVVVLEYVGMLPVPVDSVDEEVLVVLTEAVVVLVVLTDAGVVLAEVEEVTVVVGAGGAGMAIVTITPHTSVYVIVWQRSQCPGGK
jgi:hypothetical protein